MATTHLITDVFSVFFSNLYKMKSSTKAVNFCFSEKQVTRYPKKIQVMTKNTKKWIITFLVKIR